MAVEEDVFTVSSYSITSVTSTTAEISLSGSWSVRQINGSLGTGVLLVNLQDGSDIVNGSVSYASMSGTTTATVMASGLTSGATYAIPACEGNIFYDGARLNITSQIEATTQGEVDDESYLNKRGLAHYDSNAKARTQEFSIGQGSTNPVFDGMTPVRTLEWDIATAAYRPIYTIPNTGWTYMNMDIVVAYRITVTGTNINQVTDVVDRWHNPVNYPISSVFMRTQSTSAGTTGLRYLRAVYPTSSYLNNSTYPLGMEIYPYNSTSRHIKIEVFKDNSNVTWSSSLPSSPIYVSSTYNGNNSIETYTSRGWKFRQPLQMYASNAGYASYISDFEAVNTAAGDLKSGATALVAGHYAYLADDGLVYDVSNTTKNIAMGESKFGFMNSAVNANTAISYTYWRAISRPNATQVGYFNHDTFALGNRVFLRCTMDSNGNIHSDNYLSTTMSAGYTWMPFGWARSATTLYVDTRFPKFYTLDSEGKLTYIDGQEVATGMASVAWEDITGKPSFATVATSGSYNDLSNKPTIPTVNNGTLTIQKNGSNVQTFTANQSTSVTANITVPTKTSDLTNDGSDGNDTYVEAGDLATVATSGSYNDLTNKPTIPAAQVQSNWTQTTTTAVDYIKNKPTLATVATSGSYNDLSNKPTIPAAQVNSDWNSSSGVSQILNKPTLATVATSGSYNDLSNKPTIPTVNNATLTIQKNGSSVGTFTANASTNVTANIVVPTKTSDITNDSDFVTSSGTVAKANQLNTARTIGISGGVTGTATSFNGTSNISIPVTGMYETYLNWGNQVKNSSVSLIDAAMGEDFAANRLAYLPASCITIEYSRDSGETWVDYGATDTQKINLTTLSQSFYTGGSSSLASGTCQLRVTITPGNNLYMTTRKLLVNISTNGVSNSKMIIEKRAMGASSFTTERSATTITGWSGWNSFPMAITYGGTASWSNDAIRLTFLYDGKSDSYPNAQLSLSRIRLYGETAWSAPSDLAKNGHLYTFDANKNATFPAQITATRLNGSAQYLEGNSRISSADITHIYTNNQVHQRLDIASGSMSTNKPASDGFINTFMWDNSGAYDAQLFLPNGAYNNSGRPQLRFKADTSTTFNWSQWKSLAYLDDVPTKTSDITNDSGFLTSIPTASASTLGGIKVGSNLSIDANGVLSAQTGSSYSAGNHIDITNGIISAEDYVHSEDPVSTSSVTPVVTNSMVANGTLTASKFASGELLTLTMSTTDIGEGAALAANTLYGVYD